MFCTVSEEIVVSFLLRRLGDVVEGYVRIGSLASSVLLLFLCMPYSKVASEKKIVI